jgi:hypothetical protein
MTKSELKILERVRRRNDAGALCGLGVSPGDECLDHRSWRFEKRLIDGGHIHWVPFTPKLGAGWILAGRDSTNPKNDAP